MKKFFLLLTLITGSLHTMEQSFEDEDTISLIEQSVLNALNTLQAHAENNDLKSAIAVYDFFEKLKNPKYKISPLSVLYSLGLVDAHNNIPEPIHKIFSNRDINAEYIGSLLEKCTLAALNYLKKAAHNNDLPKALAYHEFSEKLKNPKQSISPLSVLYSLGLIDAHKIIPDPVRNILSKKASGEKL